VDSTYSAGITRGACDALTLLARALRFGAYALQEIRSGRDNPNVGEIVFCARESARAAFQLQCIAPIESIAEEMLRGKARI
jgi:hypothetical protein